MSVVLDLVASLLIAGFVLLMGLRLNENIVGSSDASKANLNVQESMVEVVRSIEYDFWKMGYGLMDPKLAIAIADSDHLRFRADMNRDGTIDSVDWYVGPMLTNLPNPHTRVLYRRYNMGTPIPAGLGIAQFKLRYLTEDGAETSVKSQIWIIETTLKIESPYKVQDQVQVDQGYDQMGYAAAFWRQTRLASRNIKRHN